jgi:methionyl-tRNA formyltransferase
LGGAQRKPQEGAGTFHRVRDVDVLDEIFLERIYRAEDLLNIIRARTFPPHSGAYFRHNGRKVYVRVELCEEEAR